MALKRQRTIHVQCPDTLPRERTHIVHTWVGERAGDKRVEAALNREEPWSHLSSADLGASSKQSFDHLTQNIWLTWMAEVEKGSALNTIAVRCDAG